MAYSSWPRPTTSLQGPTQVECRNGVSNSSVYDRAHEPDSATRRPRCQLGQNCRQHRTKGPQHEHHEGVTTKIPESLRRDERQYCKKPRGDEKLMTLRGTTVRQRRDNGHNRGAEKKYGNRRDSDRPVHRVFLPTLSVQRSRSAARPVRSSCTGRSTIRFRRCELSSSSQFHHSGHRFRPTTTSRPVDYHHFLKPLVASVERSRSAAAGACPR